MALAMAVTLWVFALNRYTEKLTEMVDIEIIMPPEYTMLSQSPNNIIINLKGPQNVIDQVSALFNDNKIKARCQISSNIDESNDPIKKTITISKENLNLPDNIKIESLFPNKVEVTFSRLKKKHLHVRLIKNGKAADGYTIENEFIYPGEVEVTGPANILKTVSHINTTAINIDGITSKKNKTFPWIIDIEKKVEILKDGKNTFIPITCNDQVRVWLSISELLAEKILLEIPIAILHPNDYPYKVTLQDKSVNLTVAGPKLTLSKLSQEDIIAYVDVSSLKPPGPYKQPLHINLPTGITLKDQLPEVHIDFEEELLKPQQTNEEIENE